MAMSEIIGTARSISLSRFREAWCFWDLGFWGSCLLLPMTQDDKFLGKRKIPVKFWLAKVSTGHLGQNPIPGMMVIGVGG